MLRCIDSRNDSSQVLGFNYARGPRTDTSLQQYGLLGLSAAQRCGLELPDGVFAATARQLLTMQCASGGALVLRRSDRDQVRAVLGTDDAPATCDQRAQQRGFAYQRPTEAPFGSMTSAGVSALLLARAGMLARGEGDRSLRRSVDDAIRDGFGWLASAMSVRVNPGFAERADNHWYYWLYGLERCCELSGIARLQGRDWYYEGGLQLLSQQQTDGSFRTGSSATLRLDSTCFAVLFLAKARAPTPITGG